MPRKIENKKVSDIKNSILSRLKHRIIETVSIKMIWFPVVLLENQNKRSCIGF